MRIARVFILMMLFAVLSPLEGSALVPQAVDYQGYLTDDTGEPITNTSPGVQLTFKIYNDPTASDPSNILWNSGAQMVPVENGLFTYQLGSNSHLPDNLFSADTVRWLGITVAADPEITPRTKITSTAYAYHALRADTVTSDFWLNETGDELLGDLSFGTGNEGGYLNIGSGFARLYLSSSGDYKAVLFGDDYGTLQLVDNSNDITAYLDASGSSGGVLVLANGLGNGTASLYGSASSGGGLNLSNSSGNSRIDASAGIAGGMLTLYNLATPWITFEAGLSGDASVNFPDDAVNADEIKNEPGIASDLNSNIHVITSGTMQDIETVTITIPSAGYIVVTAKAWGNHSGTTSYATSRAQIDETSGGNATFPYYTSWGSEGYATANSHYESIFVQRVYHKTEAGTYTFRLEAGREITSGGAVHSIADPILIATFYPSNYGDVFTFASSSEAGEFEDVETMPSSRQNGDETEYTENNYKVNLSELQAKAEQLRKELLRTEMEIRDQERREQLERQKQAPRRANE